jgi:hypothetical protein
MIKLNQPFHILFINIKLVLNEASRSRKATNKRLWVFIYKCLWTIIILLQVVTITNEEQGDRTRQRSIYLNLIGHTLRRPIETMAKQTLSWKGQWKRRKVRPRNIWGWKPGVDIKRKRRTWEVLERIALDGNSCGTMLSCVFKMKKKI